MHVPNATTQLVRLSAAVPTDVVMMDRDMYWLDLCLTPRAQNARACYRDHWNPRRFKRLGKVFLLPPGETIRMCSDGVRSETCVVCHISPTVMGQWFDGELEWTDERLEAGLDIPEATIRSLLFRLAKEMQQPGFGGVTLIELITQQLAIELARYFQGFREMPSVRELVPWRMRLIDDRLTDIRNAPTLAELADLCKISVRQLTRGFRAARGCSLGEYIANRRIDYAKELLKGDQSLKTIGYSLGFATPSAFSVAFRRATGKSPSEYRREGSLALSALTLPSPGSGRG
jgi:AraC family transcriptional regulator